MSDGMMKGEEGGRAQGEGRRAARQRAIMSAQDHRID